MKKTLLFNFTPEEFQEMMTSAMQSNLENFKQYFKTKEPEKYLSRKQTSALLHVNLSTLFHWNKKGKLHPVHIGSKVLYRYSDIEKALIDLND